MTIEAKRFDVTWIEDSGSVMLDINDMMDLQQRVFIIVHKAAVLACEFVAHQYRLAEFCIRFISTLASRLLSVLFGKGNEVEVTSKPIWVLFGIKVPMSSSATSLTGNGRISLFAKSLIPNIDISKLRLTAIRMMAAFVIGYTQTSAFAIDRESHEYLAAPAFACGFDSSSLEFGNSHVSSIADSGKNEKGVNCWKPLTIMPRAISSQGSQECDQGSTTRAWSPERTVKPHECTPRKGRYSLGCMETCRSEGLNTLAITKPTLLRQARCSGAVGRKTPFDAGIEERCG